MTDQLFQTGSLLWLDVALKSSLLLAVTLLAALLLRRTSAAMQHRVWVLCFAACLFVPVISIAVPGWTLPVVAQSWLNNETASATEVTVQSLMHPPVDVSSLTSDFSLSNAWPRGDESGVAQSLSHEGDRFLSPVLPVTTSGDVRDSAGTTPLATSRSGVATLSNVSWVAVGLVIWTVGVALCLLRTLWQYRSMQRVKRQCMETSQPEWLKLRDDAASAIGLTRAVRLFHCEEARTPMVVGVWRPMILLPRDAENWNTAHRRSVLLHELGHIQRHDVATQLLAGLVCALHWFNPLGWCGLAQMRKLRELACDDLVLACGQPPADYADVLLDVARSYRDHSLAMAVGMARSSHVEHRILAILDRARNHMTLTPRTARLSLLTATALVLLIGSMRLETRANPPAETTIEETSTQLAQATGDTTSQQPKATPANETTRSNAGLLKQSSRLNLNDEESASFRLEPTIFGPTAVSPTSHSRLTVNRLQPVNRMESGRAFICSISRQDVERISSQLKKDHTDG
ncbi:MAG: M56 family metallopeptidase [Planctomycetaceae bacterium]